jgi:hydrogenase maturation protease
MSASRITLVIGYGNTLRSDDAVGCLLVEQLAALKLPGVRTRVVHQLTPELAADVAEAEVVLFVDATVDVGVGISVGPAEDSTRVTVHSVASSENARISHAGSPANLLALARLLCGAEPEAHVIAVLATELGLGEHLSPAVERAMPAALAAIRRIALREGPPLP